VEPAWRLRPHLRGSRGRRPKAQTHHDRRDASEGASHGGQPFEKGAVPRRIGRMNGGLNSKLPVVCYGAGKPILLAEGQMSGAKGARLMHDTLPAASTLIADRGYDSYWFRDWPSRCRFSLLWVGVFGFLWFVFATASLSIHDPIVGGSPLRGSLLPASIAGSLFVFALSGSKYIENISALLYIGRNTLPIFCLHVLFVAGTRIVLAKFFGISEVMLILKTQCLP